MQIEQTRWMEKGGWTPVSPGGFGGAAQLVLVFAGTSLIQNPDKLAEVRAAYPRSAYRDEDEDQDIGLSVHDPVIEFDDPI